jgi:hypothetical protein
MGFGRGGSTCIEDWGQRVCDFMERSLGLVRIRGEAKRSGKD